MPPALLFSVLEIIYAVSGGRTVLKRFMSISRCHLIFATPLERNRSLGGTPKFTQVTFVVNSGEPDLMYACAYSIGAPVLCVHFHIIPHFTGCSIIRVIKPSVLLYLCVCGTRRNKTLVLHKNCPLSGRSVGRAAYI